MKRTIYIACFILLGALLSTLVHGVIEIRYIGLLLRDFGAYGLGLSWRGWELVHHAGATLLLIGGVSLGFRQGNFWWPRLYDSGGKLKSRSQQDIGDQ